MSKLSIVGIGPGNIENMTILADKVLKESDVIIGYTLYVDLLREHYPEKTFLSTPMTREADRCRQAIELAAEGEKVALVCSGDSGVYGMAALVYEIRGEQKEPELEVIPGLTAAQSGGALLGAPLTHDFSVISLSDRLTSWELIEKRLKVAASADFSIVLYNPVSHGRPDHLKKACEIIAPFIPEDRICGIAHKIGREGEHVWIGAFKDLPDADADMFCTVFIGNSATRLIDDKMVTPRGYRNV